MTLPEGWINTALIHVCELLNGRAYAQHELLKTGKWPVLRVGNFFSNKNWYYSDLDLEPDKYCENGDLLYAWSASFGPRIWDGEKSIYHYHIWKTKSNTRVINKGYLFRWFDWDTNNIKADHGTGTTMIHVTKGDMERRSIPIPPLPEQRRIVAKLDALTARLARARAELDRTAKLAARFRRQALLQCFTAREGAASVALGSILTAIQSGKNMRCVERPPQVGERGVVKVSAVTWGRFNPEQSKTLPADYVPPEVARIRSGDLLISRANTLELVGRPVLVEDEPRDLFLSDKILRLVAAPSKKRWILWFLRSPEGRQQIEGLSSGNQVSMRNIGQQAIRQIEIPLPEEAQRDRLLAMLETAFARADRLEAEAARARALLDRLEAAILARAFRGELVPQDPDDEPASFLLDRIRAERAAAPKPKRGRRSAGAS